jgi:choline dehydrogenase-like flavoprotein
MPSGSSQTFDVIVVGSGASGGWAAKRLSEAGVKVGLLDAGRALKDADYKEHVPAFSLKHRDRAPEVIRRTRPVQKDCYACREWNADWFRNDHELGVARMGHDRKKSVLNQFQQAHDVENLFVMDGAGFPSIGCQNPTLTIMALTVRSTDYLLGQMKKGNL